MQRSAVAQVSAERHPHRKPRQLPAERRTVRGGDGVVPACRSDPARWPEPALGRGVGGARRGESPECAGVLRADARFPSPDGGAVALHALGRDQESKEALDQLEQQFADEPTIIAGARAGRGDLDGAFESLEVAVRTRHARLWTLWFQMQLRPLRSDPRFPALMERIGANVDWGCPVPGPRRGPRPDGAFTRSALTTIRAGRDSADEVPRERR